MFSSFSSHTVTVQVQLLSRLLFSWSNTWARLQRHGIFRQTSSVPEAPAGATPSSPVRSSAGTALPDTSTCSPSADLGSPTEVCVTPAVTYVSRLRQLCLLQSHLVSSSSCSTVGWKLKPQSQQAPHTAGYWLHIKINFFVCVLLSCLLCLALWIIKGQTILV